MQINHVAINCLDLYKVEDFFLTYFSATEEARYHNPRTGLHSRMLGLEGSSAKLELMSWPDTAAHRQEAHMQGLVHISISVGSHEVVDGLTARLVADGYKLVSGPRTTGDGYYESCFIGPEDLIVEITI